MNSIFGKSFWQRQPLLLAASLVLLAASGVAATRFRFDRRTTAEGLPQNSVNAIAQTRDGYLWVGTFGGLARFDGVRFTIFNTVNAPALKSSRITALHEDRAGVLWAATETGEISCYKDNEFHSFDEGEEEEIDSLYVDARGFLWAGGTNGARRYRLPENNCGASVHDFERIKPPPLLGNQFADQISTILETGDGAIWLNNYGVGEEKEGKPGRLLRWRENAPLEVFDVSAELREAAARDEPQKFFITDIALGDQPETLWIAGRSGLLRFDGKRFVKTFSQSESEDERFKFARDAAGNLIVNLSGAVARLNAAGRWETSVAEEIAGKQARAFFVDRENNLWLGTNADGLLRLKENFIESFDESKGVARNQTAAVLQDSLGNLWIAGFGLHRFENDRFVRDAAVPEAYLLALAETRDGTLLAGGYDALFARRADNSVADLSGEIKKIFGNVPFGVKAIFEDSRGRLWLGFRDKGLLRRDENKNYRRFTVDNGLLNNQVQFIAETNDGAVWFGTLGGASRFENERFTNFTIADGLINNNVRAIAQTADDSIYFGTYGGGLSRLKDKQIRTATMKDGLFDDVVSRIIVDENENFWMLGNQGVFTVNKRELDRFFDGGEQQIFCRSFGAADGMLSAEGNGGSQPAGWLAADKRLWFPTIRGYVRIAPPPPEDFLPPAVIETVKINNKTVDARLPVAINSGDQNLEIEYTGLSFNRSEQLRFRYKLEGFDRNWTEAGTRRTAYYSYPPAGEYVFSLQAANADGVWNERQSARLRLVVSPPFYRTWWFYALAVSLAIGAGYLIYALRVSRLNRAKRAQELLSRRLIQLQEEERKRIAGDLHDSLSQNLVIIKNRAMISLQERHDLDSVFEQIEEIAEAAADSLHEVREIAANLRPFQIDRLGLTKAVEALARKADTTNLKVAARVDEIDDLLKPEMEINLYRIVQESLNNIIKHSAATVAAIEIERQPKTIQVTIRDNGKGFDFSSVHRAEQANENGFGLMNIRERARILGTVPIVETNLNKGTVIRLTIVI